MSEGATANENVLSENAENSCENFSEWISTRKRKMKLTLKLFLLLLYLAYYGYAMYCSFGDEESIRLTVFTGFGLYMLAWRGISSFESFQSWFKKTSRNVRSILKYGRRPLVIKLTLYMAMAAVLIQHLIRNIALKEPSRLMSLTGIAASIVVMLILSTNRRRINWHTIYVGMWLQFIFGYAVLNWSFGRKVLTWMTDRLLEFLQYANGSTVFIFGPSIFADNVFALIKIIPTIIIFCSALQVLIYLRVVQWLVRSIGMIAAFVLDVSAPEAMCASANIFFDIITSSILVLESLEDMPRSHLFAVITAGLGSSAGIDFIQFMALGVPATYLLSASTMCAPAVVVCAKLMYPDEPEVEDPVLNGGVTDAVELVDVKTNEEFDDIKSPEDNTGSNTKETKEINKNQTNINESIIPQPKNFGEAMISGGKMGLIVVGSIISTIVVFMGALEMVDQTVTWFAARVNVDTSFREILAYVFYPFAFLMGTSSKDCLVAGNLLGYRTASFPLLAYTELTVYMDNRRIFESYTMDPNNTWGMQGDDIFLYNLNETLKGGIIEERTEVILTYAMVGNASIVSVGFAIGALGAIIPKRLPDIMKMVPRTLLAGSLASYLTACIAGLLL